MKWIIEKDIFDENLEELQKQIIRQGMQYEIIERVPFNGGNYSHFTSHDFFYGSLELCEDIRKQSQCTIFHSREKYFCSYYYPYFRDFLFNHHHTMLPYKDLVEKKEFLLNSFGSGEYKCMFVRPDDGGKIFTGIVMCKKTFESDIEFIERYNKIPPETIIMVAPAKQVEMEYRFVIHDKKVITGSLYKVGGSLNEKLINDDHDAFKFAKKVVNEAGFCPDPMWVLDVCMSDGRFYVLEVGCLSCAGWYKMDLGKIVNVVNKTLEWKRK